MERKLQEIALTIWLLTPIVTIGIIVIRMMYNELKELCAIERKVKSAIEENATQKDGWYKFENGKQVDFAPANYTRPRDPYIGTNGKIKL